MAPPLGWRTGVSGRLLASGPTMADEWRERPIRAAEPFCLIKRSPGDHLGLFLMFQSVSNGEASAAEMLYYAASEVFQRRVTPPLQGSALSKSRR